MTYSGAVTLNGPVEVTAAGGGAVVFSNTISGGSSAPLIKVGAGTVTLSHANAYTGTTVVQQGTLRLSVANAIASTQGVGLDGGVLSTGGLNQTLGTLTLYSSSNIDLESGASIAHFSDSHLLSWNGTLEIDNWTGNQHGGGTDQLYVGSSNTALTLAQLAEITFAGHGAGALILGSGEIVPFLKGDMNQDGHVNASDIKPMMEALTNLAGYKTDFSITLSDQEIASLMDFDNNSARDNGDLQGFLTYLKTGHGSTDAVPEPATWVLALLGFAVATPSLIKRHRAV